MFAFVTDSERRMAQRLREGDARAMRDFYALYSGRLSAVCLRYLGSRDDVKDVMQESMISLMQYVEGFEYRGKGSLLAWATRIVVNQCLRFLRERAVADVVPLDGDMGCQVAEEPPEVDDLPPEVLQRFITELPTGYRTVFNLHVLEGRSHKEIAAMLHIKEDSSASQLNRAKKMLAKKIKDYKNSKQRRS